MARLFIQVRAEKRLQVPDGNRGDGPKYRLANTAAIENHPAFHGIRLEQRKKLLDRFLIETGHARSPIATEKGNTTTQVLCDTRGKDLRIGALTGANKV